ncbi:MAG TPA: MBL fold metallo-hydrolase [Chitinophagaceae bacterium]|nr:MBL fold metallo-hydrolase [Chitinophagaceae bacterium]
MSLYITSLNSGSNGNCYYVGNNEEAVLVDAGISCRETERRLRRLGLGMDKVKAIFVSHEHSDHIKGIPVLARRYRLPVYITDPAHQYCGFRLEQEQVRSFQPHEPVQVGSLTITAFPKFHDASDPYSFVIACNDVKVGVFTDIGHPCQHVINYFRQCHAAFLEANYDEDMLENGRYPYYLKQRIRGEKGHLSNRQALELFTRHRPSFMSHLLLSHLSKENNDPQLVQNLFTTHANGTEIVVASRFKETAVFHINAKASAVKRPAVTVSQLQLSFA